jgi:hypothetical protein
MRARVAPNNAPMFKLLEDMEKNSTELKVSWIIFFSQKI